MTPIFSKGELLNPFCDLKGFVSHFVSHFIYYLYMSNVPETRGVVWYSPGRRVGSPDTVPGMEYVARLAWPRVVKLEKLKSKEVLGVLSNQPSKR